METIKGTIKQIVYENRETGFKVLSVRTAGGPRLKVIGEFGPEMVVGVIAHFHGDYKNHQKYGTNFKTTGYLIVHNVEELAAIRLFIDAIAPNIGPERAGNIISHFGSDLISILDVDPQRLTEVDGIGKISAESLAVAWAENKDKWAEQRHEYTLRAFLNSIGIKERRIKRILSYFGGSRTAERVIKENPYKLTEIEGFAFNTADSAARQLGVLESDPMRLKAFVYYVLETLCPRNGHLFLFLDELLTQINDYCSKESTSFIGKRELHPMDLGLPIKELIEEKTLIRDKDALYSRRNYFSETQSATKIVNILEKESDLIFLDEERVDSHIESFERENPDITLSEEQRDALHYFVGKKVFVITGAPGTGKTTVLKAIVDLILKLNLRLTCLTPTGIAAKKMATTINYKAYTIHRLLGFRGSEWIYGEDNKYDTDVVIIDETSMVDQEVFYRLLAALKDRVHIIFVGDDHQLPSVGAGNVLRQLINCKKVPVVRLEQIFRQDEASDIIKVAHRIKNGDTNLNLFKGDPKSDVFFVREKGVENIENFIIKLALKFKKEKRAFQIISPRNDGPLSVESLNTALQEILNPSGFEEERNLGNFVVRRGDRIIVVKNDYELGVFNGEVGKVVHLGSGFVRIRIQDPKVEETHADRDIKKFEDIFEDGSDKDIKITNEDARDKLKLAYALTVHKIQGQEYPYIILPFITQYGRNMLQRNLLYTAITRAKQKVIIIGHGAALEKAINNSSVYKRNTKLGERIIECLKLKRSSLPTSLGGPAGFLDAHCNEVPF